MRFFSVIFLVVVAAAVLVGSYVSAKDQSPKTAEVNQLPQDWSVVIAEITEYPKYVGLPIVCPGTDANENQDEIICTAEMFEAEAHLLMHIDGLKTPKDLKIRFSTHILSKNWKKGRRFIMHLASLEDDSAVGYFVLERDAESENGEFCMQESIVNDLKSLELKNLFELGRTELFGEDDLPQWRWKCITAPEKT